MRILLVEDHQDSAYLTSRLLRGHGHVVDVASSVQEAKAICAARTYDLLICDIRLPDGDGWELMSDLRRTCQIRGIALSGLAYTDDVKQSLSVGFDAHLKKPVDFMDLAGEIKKIEASMV